MATRWQLHTAIAAMPSDPDGVWSDVCGDGYGKVRVAVHDVTRLCTLYRLALAEDAAARVVQAAA